MHIQILGASINAAVMAYHLAAVGHKIQWCPQDEDFLAHLNNKEWLFEDVDLSNKIYRLIESGQIDFETQHVMTDIAVFAFRADQYQNFVRQKEFTAFKQYQLIINYSHLGLGQTDEIKMHILNNNIVYIPDFLKEGALISSFMTSKLIVGCEASEKIRFLVQEVFRPIFPLMTQYNFMSVRAAEFTKLSISGFLATKVSFMNDLSNAAEQLGVDIEEVRAAMATDTRIGEQYLYPGCGFGGGNLTRDVLTLKGIVQDTGNANGLLDKIWDINEYQKEIIFRKLWTIFDCQLHDKVIAFWGAAFKPNTNSLAEAPILNILEACWAQGAITRVHDPRALEMLAAKYPDQPLLILCENQYEATQGADALCLVTEWKQYGSPDYTELHKNMRGTNLIDGRNIYNPLYVRQQGFRYYGIGR